MELTYDGGSVVASNDLVLLFLLSSGDGLAANVSASNKDEDSSTIDKCGCCSGVIGLGVSSSSGVTGKGILFLGGVEYSYPAEGSRKADEDASSSLSKGCFIRFLLDLN